MACCVGVESPFVPHNARVRRGTFSSYDDDVAGDDCDWRTTSGTVSRPASKPGSLNGVDQLTSEDRLGKLLRAASDPTANEGTLSGPDATRAYRSGVNAFARPISAPVYERNPSGTVDSTAVAQAVELARVYVSPTGRLTGNYTNIDPDNALVDIRMNATDAGKSSVLVCDLDWNKLKNNTNAFVGFHLHADFVKLEGDDGKKIHVATNFGEVAKYSFGLYSRLSHGTAEIAEGDTPLGNVDGPVSSTDIVLFDKDFFYRSGALSNTTSLLNAGCLELWSTPIRGSVGRSAFLSLASRDAAPFGYTITSPGGAASTTGPTNVTFNITAPNAAAGTSVATAQGFSPSRAMVGQMVIVVRVETPASGSTILSEVARGTVVSATAPAVTVTTGTITAALVDYNAGSNTFTPFVTTPATQGNTVSFVLLAQIPTTTTVVKRRLAQAPILFHLVNVRGAANAGSYCDAPEDDGIY